MGQSPRGGEKMSMRPIDIPNIKLPPDTLLMMVDNNDDILLSFCWNKKPKHGVITNYGIRWENYDEFRKDADNTCHEFYQLLVIYPNNMVIAPCHADEVYNLHISPWTGEKLPELGD
jgi:hypothetical protein